MATIRIGRRFAERRAILGGRPVQTTQPRDLGALVLVVGFILILFLVTVALGPSGH